MRRVTRRLALLLPLASLALGLPFWRECSSGGNQPRHIGNGTPGEQRVPSQQSRLTYGFRSERAMLEPSPVAAASTITARLALALGPSASLTRAWTQ
jgi:hypothetical protein